MNDERLWGYARLTRMWARSMLVAAALVALFAVVVTVGDGDADRGRWAIIFAAVTLGTFVVGAPFVRFAIAPPSSRLPEARPLSGRRRLEALPGEWRRWGLISAAVVTVGSAAMMLFLIAILGDGGTAEGVVVGLLAAWSVATFADAHQITATEGGEGRTYYAAVRSPTAVGRHLVWTAPETP